MNLQTSGLAGALYELPVDYRAIAAREDDAALSNSVERLLETVEHHAVAEESAYVLYEQVAAESGDPVVQLVMRLILDDETRHHGLLRRIATSLNDGLRWQHSPDALPSGIEPPTGRVAPGTIETTRDLIREEREGARQMRGIAQREKQLNGGLVALLLETMARDSEKHEYLLRFIAHRLESQIGAPVAARARRTGDGQTSAGTLEGPYAA